MGKVYTEKIRMNINAVGNNIRNRLDENCMSQRQLAQAIGVTDVTMNRWVTGWRQPTAYGLYRISKVFGCTMEDLMEGIEDVQDTKRVYGRKITV